MMKAKSKI